MVVSPGTSIPEDAAPAARPSDSQSEFSIQAWNPEPAPVIVPEPQIETPVNDQAEYVQRVAPAQAQQPSQPASASGRVLRSGDSGPAVRELESRLKELRHDPGKVDGSFDQYTRFAVISFQKVSDLKVDGLAGPAVMAALDDPGAPHVLQPGGAASRVEVDLSKQLMVVYQESRPVLITDISTGSNEIFCSSGRCRRAETPTGNFKFLRRISGWRTAELGRLYNPVYFTDDGVAVHGSASVPLHPVSHGCVRIPMHTADLFPKLVQNGTDIHVAG